MNNLSSYCGLVDAKIRASDIDLYLLIVILFKLPVNRSRDDDTEEDTAKKARTAAAAATASASEQEQAGEFIPLRLDTPVQDPAVQDEGNFYDNY